MLLRQLQNLYLIIIIYRLYYEKSILILISNLVNIETNNLIKNILVDLNDSNENANANANDEVNFDYEFVSNCQKLIIKLIKIYQINIMLNIVYTIWYNYYTIMEYDDPMSFIINHNRLNSGFSLASSLIILNPFMKYCLILINYILGLIILNLNLIKFDVAKKANYNNINNPNNGDKSSIYERKILSNIRFLILETHGILTILFINLYDFDENSDADDDVLSNTELRIENENDEINNNVNEQSNLINDDENNFYDDYYHATTTTAMAAGNTSSNINDA